MKLKRVLRNIEEEFVTGFKSEWGEGYMEIFKNPTSQEIKEVVNKSAEYNEIRFIADYRSRDLYIAPVQVTHQEMARELEFPVFEVYEFMFPGIGKIRSEVIVVDVDDIFYVRKEELNIRKLKNDIFKGKYNWLDDYGFDLELLEIQIKDRYESNTQF